MISAGNWLSNEKSFWTERTRLSCGETHSSLLARSVLLLPEQSDLSLYKFVSNRYPSLGVEIELNLVDSQTMALRSGVSQILSEVPAELESSVKPELFQCYIELNTQGLPGRRRGRERPGQESSRSSARSPAATTCGFSGAALIRFRPGRTRRSRPTSATTA